MGDSIGWQRDKELSLGRVVKCTISWKSDDYMIAVTLTSCAHTHRERRDIIPREIEGL